MAKRKTKPKRGSQITAFTQAARELECNESEESFEKALGKIGKTAPVAKPKLKKKRKPLKLALDDV